MSLTQFNTTDQSQALLQNSWASKLNPVLANPLTTCTYLKNVPLVTGANRVNHMLGRTLQGWVIVRQRGNAQIWDSQDINQIPDKTLILNSTSGISVDLAVF